jgi:hypothetical protein
MIYRTFLTVGLAVLVSTAGRSADLVVLPGELTLRGPGAAQQLLLVEKSDGRTVADRTSEATFTSSHPRIVGVDASGLVRAAGNGEAIIRASVAGRSASIHVRVSGVGEPTTPNFVKHVLPVLTRNGCNSGACHGALAGKGGFKLSLRGYNPESDHFALTRQAQARRVNVTAPADSLVLKKATRAIPHGGGTRFGTDSEHYRVIEQWIQAGAPGTGPNDPRLVGLDVFPPASLLKPKQTIRLLVRATYSDGTTADVTRLARFVSSEEQVAGVDEDGTVTVNGPGEAGVSAIFGTRVVTAVVTVPFPASSESDQFRAASTSFVDDLIDKKLRLLNLSPSPPCTDAEFIRRLWLDLCGVLPTPEEVKVFVEDPRPDKRDRLIDRLLGRPEYVDYWAHKWSDLLLVSSRRLPQPAVWAFYRAVRRSVADNQPWDQFAREVLTATGSTMTGGGGNYFVIHKDVTDLTESTSVTFLGMSIQCARCHNHPLEKWTQDQYWAMANLFARVGLKNGGRTGEVIVQSLSAGDALHPRTGRPVPPAPLDGRPLDSASPLDRRRYFADWLTAPDNPYFAKALVNRVWKNFMGRGLVEAEDDLRETNPPTNRELFDALAKDFVAHNYDVKHLIRTITRSAAYQRSSAPLPGNAADDRFYSRYLIRRLPAEVILDAYSDVTGVPTPFETLSLGPSGGTTAAQYPHGVRAMQLPDSQLVSRFLDAFGRAEREQTCSCERSSDSSIGQALHLNNGQTVNEKLRHPDSRLSKWIAEGAANAVILDRVFRHALSRPSGAVEKKRFLEAIAAAAKDGPAARREALEDAIWAVQTGKEFHFNH